MIRMFSPKRPLGFVPLKFKISFQQLYFERVQFNTDYNLRLNLTFFYIYFSSLPTGKRVRGGSVRDCYFGNIAIISRFSGLSDSIFTFCGLHSNLTNFPPSRNVVMSLTTGKFVIAPTFMFFSVFDANLVVSVHSSSFATAPAPLWVVQFVKAQTSTQMYHLRVAHDSRIALRVLTPYRTSWRMYDGPGVKSPQIYCIYNSLNITKCIGSTFQSVVYFCKANREEKWTLEFYAGNINAQYITISILPGSEVFLSFPSDNTCSSSKICSLHLHTSPNLTVNVTIVEMHHTGENNSIHCKFSGIAAYALGTQAHKFLSNQCLIPRYENFMNRSFNDTFHNIYERNMILTLYHYPEYTLLSAKLLLSTCPCEPIVSDPCAKTSHIEVSGVQFDKTRHTFVVTLSQRHCFLFQLKMEEKQKSMLSKQCLLSIRHSLMLEKGSTLIITASGFFKGE